jgi:hypothetical protein
VEVPRWLPDCQSLGQVEQQRAPHGAGERMLDSHAVREVARQRSERHPSPGRFETKQAAGRRLQHRGGIATALDGLGILAAHTGQPDWPPPACNRPRPNAYQPELA